MFIYLLKIFSKIRLNILYILEKDATRKIDPFQGRSKFVEDCKEKNHFISILREEITNNGNT